MYMYYKGLVTNTHPTVRVEFTSFQKNAFKNKHVETNITTSNFYYFCFIIIYQSIIQKAIDVSQEAHREWERRSIEERSQIFLRAADLISGKYRMDLLATTMLGQVGDDITWSGEGGGQILSMLNTVYEPSVYRLYCHLLSRSHMLCVVICRVRPLSKLRSTQLVNWQTSIASMYNMLRSF